MVSTAERRTHSIQWARQGAGTFSEQTSSLTGRAAWPLRAEGGGRGGPAARGPGDALAALQGLSM